MPILMCSTAAENSTDDSQSSQEPGDNKRPIEYNEEANRLLDQLFDPFPSRYLDESETLDSTDATDRLMDKISDIRERQCFACIQGLGYFSDPNRDELVEILKSLIPREYRSIIAMKPLLEPIIARYADNGIEGSIPLYQIERECTTIYRTYIDVTIQQQISSIEAGSESDLLYELFPRLAPSDRMQALEDYQRWFNSEDSLEYERCKDD